MKDAPPRPRRGRAREDGVLGLSEEQAEEWGSGGRALLGVVLGGTRRGLLAVDEVAGRTETKAVEKER